MPKAPDPHKLLTDHKNTLLPIALAAQKNSHAPYSGFRVGSAVLADDKQTYAGCNVENAAYPLGQCAEAGAISAMVLAGAKKIKEILIASPNQDYCPPCGGCRQKIFEFCDQDTLVHMATSDGKVKTVTMFELLPMAFKL
ncbi:MAG: cytidine deaminase [Paraglaciecola sp.]|jgi:cytidine deaminase